MQGNGNAGINRAPRRASTPPPTGNVRGLGLVDALRVDLAPPQLPWLEVPRGARVDGELRVARWPRDNFHDPADHAAILTHVERHAGRGQELFCGIVPKAQPQPRKEAAKAGRVVWVNIDRKSPAAPPRLEEIERLLDPGVSEVATDALVAAARLLALPARPHLVALSGSGGAHGYYSRGVPRRCRFSSSRKWASASCSTIGVPRSSLAFSAATAPAIRFRHHQPAEPPRRRLADRAGVDHARGTGAPA